MKQDNTRECNHDTLLDFPDMFQVMPANTLLELSNRVYEPSSWEDARVILASEVERLKNQVIQRRICSREAKVRIRMLKESVKMLKR